MCFSATASFTVAAVLFPAGAYCIKTARRIDKKWIPLAICPMAFSIQQTIEGVVWLGVNSGDQEVIAVASRGFMFFSHFFWLAWIPFCVYWLEGVLWRRRLLLMITGIGTISGASAFLPSFFIADWLSVELVQNSLEYHVALIYDDIFNRTVLRGFYGLIIVSALFLSSDWRMLIFGGLIVASLITTYLFFAHSAISVWCFFAAIVSLYIVVILEIERRRWFAYPQ
jgi:hypothetical protein